MNLRSYPDRNLETPRSRALNAYRHGLTGQVLILTPDDQAACLTHSHGIHESLVPEGGMETGMVQSVADDCWLLARAGAMENANLAGGVGDGRATQFTHSHEQIDVAYAQGVAWLKEGHRIALLTLYQGRIQRRAEKNLTMLRQLQKDRKAALQQVVEEETPRATRRKQKANPTTSSATSRVKHCRRNLFFHSPKSPAW